VIEDTDQ